MELVIVLRKTVADKEAGEALTNIVRQKLADHPEIIIDAKVTEKFEE